MLFAATVPNTYVSTRASLAVGWGRTPTPTAPVDLVAFPLLCECGNRKARGKLACARCAAFEAATDGERLEAVVRTKFKDATAWLTVSEITDDFAGRYPRHMIYYACRRLVRAGVLVRKPTRSKVDNFIYRLA